MPDKQPNIKAIEEDIRFTKYRLSFMRVKEVFLKTRLANLEGQLAQAQQQKAA